MCLTLCSRLGGRTEAPSQHQGHSHGAGGHRHHGAAHGDRAGQAWGEGEGVLRQRKEGKGLRDADSQPRRKEHDERGHLGVGGWR